MIGITKITDVNNDLFLPGSNRWLCPNWTIQISIHYLLRFDETFNFKRALVKHMNLALCFLNWK